MSVNDALATTFELLATTGNEAAMELLIPALDAPQPQIREAALQAILARSSLAGRVEALHRLHRMDQPMRNMLQAHRGGLTHALRDALRGTDRQLCANACQAILWLDEFELVPDLVAVIEDEANPHRELASDALCQLIDSMHQQQPGKGDGNARRYLQLVRREATVALEPAVCRFGKNKRRELVEMFLSLASRDNATLQQIMRDADHPCHLATLNLLLHSPRPAIRRLLLSFLDESHAPGSAINTLARRSDAPFIHDLLRKIGNNPSAVAAQNLKRVKSIPWLQPSNQLLQELDGAAQHSLIKLAMSTSIKRLELFDTIKLMALKGSVPGRRAAVEALAEFNGAEANRVALKALEDTDPQVQAIVARQLRQRGVPGAMQRLMKLIESPHEIVRVAARESLSEFRFKRFLSSFDLLEPEVKASTGAMIRKIDPSATLQLVEEMQSRARSRRLRSIEMAQAMDCVEEVEAQLIELLRDEDHLVRNEAAHALGNCHSDQVQQALREALLDRSVQVQEAARRGLEAIASRAAADGQSSTTRLAGATHA